MFTYPVNILSFIEGLDFFIIAAKQTLIEPYMLNMIYLFKEPFARLNEIILTISWMLYYGVNVMLLSKANILWIYDGVKVFVERHIVFQSNSLDINYYVNQKCI